MKERLAVGKYISFQCQWKNFLFSSLTSKSLLFVFYSSSSLFLFTNRTLHFYNSGAKEFSSRQNNFVSYFYRKTEVLSGINKIKLCLCVYLAKCDWCGKLLNESFDFFEFLMKSVNFVCARPDSFLLRLSTMWTWVTDWGNHQFMGSFFGRVTMKPEGGSLRPADIWFKLRQFCGLKVSKVLLCKHMELGLWFVGTSNKGFGVEVR